MNIIRDDEARTHPASSLTATQYSGLDPSLSRRKLSIYVT